MQFHFTSILLCLFIKQLSVFPDLFSVSYLKKTNKKNNLSCASSCPLEGRSILPCLGSPLCPPPCLPAQRTQAWMTCPTAAPWKSQRLRWRERSDWLWRERSDTAGRGGWLDRAWRYPGTNKQTCSCCCSSWQLESVISYTWGTLGIRGITSVTLNLNQYDSSTWTSCCG